jgi:hypothetical protein
MLKTKPASFSSISDELWSMMTANDPWSNFFYPVFGSNHFPITYYTNIDTIPEVLQELCSLYKEFSKEDCHAYNQSLLAAGVVRTAPANLEGICVKEIKGACRATGDKWSCGGCGISWVPGSYMSKTCKQHPDPFWLEYLQADVKAMLDQHGVSDTAPIVWVNGQGERRFKPKS